MDLKIGKLSRKRSRQKKQLEQMKIAWKFITRIRSNSILIIDKPYQWSVESDPDRHRVLHRLILP